MGEVKEMNMSICLRVCFYELRVGGVYGCASQGERPKLVLVQALVVWSKVFGSSSNSPDSLCVLHRRHLVSTGYTKSCLYVCATR
jgi:hypothetical protein